MKNFTKQNFKTNPLWIRLIIMAFMLLAGASSAWAWSYKLASSGWNCKGNTGWSDVALYTTPTGSSKQNLSVAMLTNPGDGFNILRANNCNEWNDSDHNHCLYVGLSGTAATNTSTIVRATAYWNNGLYSKYTVVVPGGKVYIKPTGGNEVEMTKNSYTYTASVSLSSAKTFDLYGASVTTSSIQNQWDMPAGGKPSSVRLSYTGLNSPYQYVKITYDLKTNQITFEEEDAPCDPPAVPSLTNPDPQCGGFITLPASAEGVNLKWYDAQTGGNVVSNTEVTATGTYWAAAVAECESTDRTAYTVTINPIPEVNSLLSPLNICIGSIDETDLTTLSHVEVSSGSTAVWYTSEDGVEQAERANLINGGTYWVAAENSTTGCKSTTRTSFTININDLPQSPSLGKYKYETCAHASNTVSLNELAGVSDVIWYLGEEEVNEEVSIETAGIYTYTAKAVNVNGCQSATGVDFKLTVNSLPTITSISASNDKPVPFEDVVLTANNVTNGAQVNWYVGEDLVAENTNTYTVTSETAGEVIVKAKAFLNGCESIVASHTVIFSAENCNSTTTTTTVRDTDKMQILCREDGSTAKSNLKCYAFDKNKKEIFGKWDNAQTTNTTTQIGGNIYRVWTINNISTSYTLPITVIFYYKDNNNTYQTNDLATGETGFAYKYWYKAADKDDKSKNGAQEGQGSEITKTTTTTTPAPITAPAVKMVSAEYDEVNDKIVAKGAVYRTGCGETFWGFQYSADGQKWGTADADFIRPSSGNSLSEPGVFAHSFEIPNANGGDIYYIRAYAINNYNKDYYSLNSAVFSETKIPVEIPSSTIESATISLVDSEGNPSTNSKVCPQSTVYLKVSYVGGDFKDYEAADNLPGTDLELVNHDKVNNYAIFSYTATSTGVANITISNENTSVTPETGVNIAVKEVAVATPPTIYLEKNTICETQTTNVVVNSPIVGLSYSLKNGSVGDPVTYESGDLKFPVSKEGSYTVQVQETVCGTTAISAPVDLRVITSDVKITLTTDVNTITPWQPLTLTVKAPSGYDYDLQGLDGTVYTKSGDVYTIKFPRPDSWRVGNSESNSEPKTFTAGIKAGEEPSCSTTTKEIQLVDTVEDCLAVSN